MATIPHLRPRRATIWTGGWPSYDLSAFKGQTVRLVFENRNLSPDSWGIWTYLDDVRVIDARCIYLPLTIK